ncbi:ABC transporter substrate-binding protein [Xanthobacter sp.]|uniref:ABC transporter substrate-binding protein n=1 Tax=Xanthobacter sp. TaxID=35809 RepID=UPI0035B3BCE4
MKSIVTGALALALMATAATTAATTTALADIKIGAVVSETGPASSLGDPEAKTIRMMVEELNAKGGIKGEKAKLVLYDDGGDPSKAKTFATRLVEDDGVVAMVGGTTTGTSLAILAVAEESKVPFISLAGAIEIIDPVKPFTFKTPHTDRMACQKIFDDMKSRGLTKIGLISGTDGFGASMRTQCIAVAKTSGIEIVADETYGPKDADMTPQLTNIRNKPGIQAVLNTGFGQGPATITRNYAQLGITLPLYQSHGVASNAFIELSGAKNAEGVRLPGTALLVGELLDPKDPQKNVVLAYKASFEKAAGGAPVSTFGGYAHDAMRILTEALAKAPSAKPAAIRDAIEGTTGLVGTTGTYNYAKTDHLGLDLSAFRMLEISNGGWKLVK